MGERKGYEPGVFCWIDIMAHDANSLEKFYTQLFGWTAERQDTQGGPSYIIFRLKGKSVCGMGEMPPDAAGAPVAWNSYVSVANVDATVAKAKTLGGTVTMPPMDCLDAGRMAMLQDPEGAQFSIWQKNKHFGAEIVNDPGCWIWDELLCRSTADAEKFYGSLFGWTFSSMKEGDPKGYRVIHHSSAGGGMNGGLMPLCGPMADHPPCWGVYFSVASLNDSLEKLKSLGGKINVEPFSIEVGDMAVVADPQGGVFCLLQMKVPAH